MTKDQLIVAFNHFDNDLGQEKALADRYRTATHGDLCAFILLDKLVPTGKVEHMPGIMHDMVSAAEHDQIWLRTDLDELALAVTEDDVKALVQLGVMLDANTESLSLFV